MRTRIDRFEVGLQELSLRSTFRTHWKTLRAHKTIVARLESGGHCGEGEAYALDPESAIVELRRIQIEGSDPWEVESILARIGQNSAARSAVDLALHDLLGKLGGVPVYRLLGITAGDRFSCYSIGIADREEMITIARAKCQEGCPILKIKMTSTVDPGIIHEIRSIG
jgi:L-Ala-D/L-Glu epimerase